MVSNSYVVNVMSMAEIKKKIRGNFKKIILISKKRKNCPKLRSMKTISGVACFLIHNVYIVGECPTAGYNLANLCVLAKKRMPH